jgi:integrase
MIDTTLPQTIWSLDGQLIHLHQSVWRLSASADGGLELNITWQALKDCQVFSLEAQQISQRYICDRLQRKKGMTVMGDYRNLLCFARWLASHKDFAAETFRWVDYTPELAQAFLHWSMTESAERGNRFSRLRVLYEWGVARQHPGFDPQVLRILKTVTAPGNVKGHHVRSRHPTQGPLSQDERWLITRALRAERGDACDRAVVMLHLELGCNPNAAVRIRSKELHRIETPQRVLYQLDVPRVKKRTAHRETKRRAISERLGSLLDSLRQAAPDSFLLHWLPPDRAEQAVNQAMRRWTQTVHLISPRTGEVLHLHARRFRYTLATHLAEEGASKFHIAEILDHTDLQNVEVYIQSTARLADYVAQATDAVLEPLVQRFLGKVVESLEEPAFPDLSTNAVIPAAVPHLALLNMGGVGVCGRNTSRDGLCQLLPPLSCYMCPLFAALRDGPHREVLASIEAYIETYREQADARILQQLDDVRFAIQQVLAKLEASHE